MGTLVCNGSSLYRRDSSLVRTPIRVRLTPKAYCSCPIGEYDSSIGLMVGARKDYYSVRNTGTDVQTYEYDTAAAMVSVGNQMGTNWWANTGDLGCVFYGGGHSPTTAPWTYSEYKVNFVAEHFMNFCAYKFEIPSSLDNLNVTDLSFTYNASCKFSFASLDNGRGSNTSNSYRMYGIINPNVAVTPLWLSNYVKNNDGGHVLFDIPARNGGLGAYNFWAFSGQLAHLDGRIPINSPWTQYNASVNPTAIDAANANRTFWLIVCQAFGWSSKGLPTPAYASTTPLWWQARAVAGVSGYAYLE